MVIFKKVTIFIKNSIMDLLKDIFWLTTFVLIFLKSIAFIGIIYSSNTKNIEIFTAARLTIFSFPIYFWFVAALLSFSFLFKNGYKIIFNIIINFLVSFLILVDLWNYRAFENFTSIHSISELTNVSNLGGSITSMIHPIDIIFIVDIIVIALFFIVYNKKLGLAKYSKRNVFTFFLIFIVAIGSIYYIHYQVDILKKDKNKFLFVECWTPRTSMLNLSPIGYHIFDIYLFWRDSQPFKLTEQQKKDISNYYVQKQEIIPDNKYKGLFKGKNLIFIETESLEACPINQKISNQEITPVINKLLDNSIYFPNFYEQVRGGTSSDAMLISNTSTFPIIRGTTFFRYPNNTYTSMPKLMNSMGYNTLAIEPDRGSYWNWMNNLKSFGYQKCMDISNLKMDEKIGMGLSDGSFLRQVEQINEKQKAPFYTFMVTQTTHTPYDLPKEYRELKMPESVDRTKLGGYLQSLHYTDKQLGIYLSNLDKSGILDNTIVVIYGDHGGVHKFYPSEISNVEPAESWWQQNYNKVPFIIYSKGMSKEVINTIGGEVDILPTVAYLMGVDEKKYTNTAMGRNLLKTNRSFAVLPSMGYIGVIESEKDRDNAVKGINLSDLIIRSNYFKK